MYLHAYDKGKNPLNAEKDYQMTRGELFDEPRKTI